MRVLVIEDDAAVARLLTAILTKAYYSVDVASDGDSGLAQALAVPYDLAIIDWMLPGRDGLALCRTIRQSQQPTAILLLTVRETVADRVLGLDSGADDYLVKPFAVEELLARVRALARRGSTGLATTDELRWGDLVLDVQAHTARRGTRLLDLTSREWRLLEYLLRHPRQVLSRQQILDYVWSYDSMVQITMVDLYISYLRRKVNAPGQPDLIKTVRGVGYRLEDAE